MKKDDNNDSTVSKLAELDVMWSAQHGTVNTSVGHVWTKEITSVCPNDGDGNGDKHVAAVEQECIPQS